MLSPYRVLDLTDDKGYLCGKILGDLGADVIKVEPPGGDPGRRVGPFYQDMPDPEKSLFWFAYNNNKRGITLNIETADGQAIFKRLLKSADFVLESFPPGYMDWLGLGYSALSHVNPRIILTSITPFGQTGPYKEYKTSDIVGMAMGGYMYLTGDPDRPPLRIGYPQAYFHAAACAAVGSLSALYYREDSGEGQHVDVSMQQCIIRTMLYARPSWEISRVNIQRMGSSRMLSTGVIPRQTWPCKDGFITFSVLGGSVAARSNKALVDWMDSEGMADDFLKSFDWPALDIATATQEFFDRVEGTIGKFFLLHTRAELYEGAAKRGVWLYPVASAKEVLENTQLADRDYWVALEHPEQGITVTYPGAFVKASETPCRISRRAPLMGEHNREIYERELGLSRQEILVLKQAGIV